MANVSTTNNAAVLQRWYKEGRVHDMTYRISPLLGILPKREDFFGEAMGFAIIGEGPVGGRSATFSNALSNKSAGKEKQFLLTRQKDYCIVSIDREAIKATNGNKGAFFKLAQRKIDQAHKVLVDNMGFMLYNNGGGARAQVGSTSTTTLTLLDTRDIHNFAVGQYLDSSTTDGTSGAADGGSIQVTGINRSAGTLTAGSNWTGAGNFADNDYIFVVGDFGNAISGLDSWLPATAPTGGDSHFGVDRSEDTDRYAGIRVDGSSLSIEEALITAEAELVGVAGADPGVVMMNPVDVKNLKIELGARIVYDFMQPRNSKGKMSYRTIVLQGSRMELRVVADMYCPKGVAYMLQPETWEFATLGAAPDICEALGHDFQWEASEDALQMRFGWFGNLGCYAPGYNARITLPSDS